MEIETSARLHLSLIDLNGSEGRIDGGIGITLNEPSLRIECVKSDTNKITFTDTNISSKYKQIYESKINESVFSMNKYLSSTSSYEFNIKQIYPIHHGLGLGTQLSLSVAKLVSQLNDTSISVYDMAKIIKRGSTSGIGVYSFDNGGFIVDGGHKKTLDEDFLPSSASKYNPPPLLARYNFPKKWKILLVTPNDSQEISGQNEVNIFKKYTPINASDVRQISYLTLMKLMPSVLEEDMQEFSSALNSIQQLGFKKIERKLQSDNTKKLLNKLEEDNNIDCYGMSSFGPTCFIITDNNTKSIEKDLSDDNFNVTLTSGKNSGYKLIE